MTLKGLIYYILRYASASILCVALDFGIYIVLLESTNLEVAFANIISTVTGFIVGWIISGKTLFKKYELRFSKYVEWFLYNAVAIFIYSYLLELLTQVITNKVFTKVVITGFSFVINSIFFRYFILTKRNNIQEY